MAKETLKERGARLMANALLSHQVANDDPRAGLLDAILYPDYNDNTSFPLTGTWGPPGVQVKGRNRFEEARHFRDPTEAEEFYSKVFPGRVLRRESWGFGPNAGGRWGLYIRGVRPEQVPTPPREGEE